MHGDALCAELGHCVYEGSGEWPEAHEPVEYDQGLQIRQTA